MNKLLTALAAVLFFPAFAFCLPAFPPDYEKKRVIISTDIGGGDFDDVQSMIHFLFYADRFDTEAIISSMPRPGNRYWRQIVSAYRRDYKKLSFHADYPTPNEIKKLYVLGSTKTFPGNRKAGARAIIRAAEKDDPRPVYVLIWGASTDLAIALKLKPSIKDKIRPILIASIDNVGFNEEGDIAAWKFMKQGKVKALFTDDMFRGIYLPALNKKGRYGNVGFVKKVLRKSGALGRLFYRSSATINVNRYGIKMGDTPSLLFLFNGNWDNPNQSSWGGKFCKYRRKIWRACKSNSFAGRRGAGHVARFRKDFLKDWEKIVTTRLKELPGISPDGS
jgi:hypothetical protein